jgi:hypothetical protein
MREYLKGISIKNINVPELSYPIEFCYIGDFRGNVVEKDCSVSVPRLIFFL